MSEHVTKASGQKARWLPDPPPEVPPRPPVRLATRKRFDMADIALPAFALATGAMVGLSAPQLIDPSGVSGWIKVGLLTGSSALVSYIVNRFAVEKGAELTARGYLSAGIISVGSILLVGGGLFASTFAGLTVERVNDLRLQQHGQALVAYVDAANIQASKAVQVKPAIDAAVADIQLHLACEEKESCLSGRANGGRGTVTRTLEPIAKRTTEISAQLHKGDTARSDRLKAINALVGDYQTTYNHADLVRLERRRALSRIDARIKQDVSALQDAMPVALLKSYAAELDRGVAITDRPEASRNVSVLLQRHGRTVSGTLEGIGASALEVPPFPDEVGVSSTFAYIGYFLPIAALTAVIELVMPLTLWAYMLLGHLWSFYRQDPSDSYPGGGGGDAS